MLPRVRVGGRFVGRMNTAHVVKYSRSHVGPSLVVIELKRFPAKRHRDCVVYDFVGPSSFFKFFYFFPAEQARLLVWLSRKRSLMISHSIDVSYIEAYVN